MTLRKGFPTFYPLSSPPTTTPTFTGASYPTITNGRAEGPEGPDPFDSKLDAGDIVGIVIGVPAGISVFCSLYLQSVKKRKELLKPYCYRNRF